MTDRKPALRRFGYLVPTAVHEFEDGSWVPAHQIPPAILNATKEELAALAVFAEAMPELLEGMEDAKGLRLVEDLPFLKKLAHTMDAALAAAKSTTAEEGK